MPNQRKCDKGERKAGERCKQWKPKRKKGQILKKEFLDMVQDDRGSLKQRDYCVEVKAAEIRGNTINQ